LKEFTHTAEQQFERFKKDNIPGDEGDGAADRTQSDTSGGK
jgi:hypothetical protein